MSQSFTFAASDVASLKPFEAVLAPKNIRGNDVQWLLESMTFVADPVMAPFGHFQLAVRPGIFTVKGPTLDVSLLILTTRGNHTHFECQVRIQVKGKGAVPSTPSLDLTIRLVMGNISAMSHYTASWPVPEHLAETEFQFTQATLTFRPIDIVDLHSMCLLVRQSNTRLAMLHARAFSDCQLITPEPSANPIFVSRAILATASPFFHVMFAGDWSKYVDKAEPIKFSWPAVILIPCLIHIYSGWLPNGPLPMLPSSVKDLIADHGFELDRFGHVEWNQVVEMAEMLELLHLAQAAHVRVEECMKERFERIRKALVEMGTII